MSDAGWTQYWRDRSRRGCVPNAPALTASLVQAWRRFAAGLPPAARVLDLAAGDGAVARAMMAERDDLAVTGVDRAAGVAGVGGAVVMGGVDAAALPFGDAAFDAMTSQFGIEYCPPAALGECARVLRRGGRVQWLVHDADSRVVRHNAARLAAGEAIVAAGLFASARRVAAGFGEDAATAARIATERRRHAAQSIVEELPAALGQALRGERAGPAIAAIETALSGELARLSALAAAAMSAAGIARLCEHGGEHGLRLTATPLRADDGTPLAWRVTGVRD